MKKFSLPLSALALLLAAAAGASLPGSGAIALNWFAEGACDDALAQNPGDPGPCRYDAREDWTSAACADGVDNDSDEATDCLDSDCAATTACAVAPRCPATELDRDGNCDQDTRGPLYGEPDLCADGSDGDGDGFTDGCDVDCAAGAGGYCPAEDCQAYGDEDGDAVWDGCDMDCAPGDGQERGCSGGEQTAGSRTTARGGGASCVPSAEVCGNGSDEDCDGLDAACSCPWWNPWCDVVSVCGDGRCDSGESCPVDCATRPVAEACDNGNDDDGDGFADCGDPDCALEAWCQGPSENCNDGGDNDGDGWADCWDSGCATGNCATFGGLGAPGWPTDPSHPGGDPRNPANPSDPGSGNPKGRNPDGTPIGPGGSDGRCSYSEVGTPDCADPDCAKEPQCDGKCPGLGTGGPIDCTDPDCQGNIEGEDFLAVDGCFDRGNNDGDCYIDCKDPDCDNAESADAQNLDCRAVKANPALENFYAECNNERFYVRLNEYCVAGTMEIDKQGFSDESGVLCADHEDNEGDGKWDLEGNDGDEDCGAENLPDCLYGACNADEVEHACNSVVRAGSRCTQSCVAGEWVTGC